MINQDYKISTFIKGGAAVLLLCVACSTFLAWQVDNNNQNYIEKLTDRESDELAEFIIRRMKIYTSGLRGARGHFLTLGEDNLSREAFRNYMRSRNIDEEHPGARGFGFIRRVPLEKETEFLAAARADGAPDFSIRKLAPHSGDQYVIQYIEPIERNQLSLGLDVASETARLRAAEDSMRTGEVRLSAPITLVQASHKPLQSFLIFLPMYRTWATPTDEAQRIAQTWGWSFAPLLMTDVLNDLPAETKLFHIELHDLTQGTNTALFINNESKRQTATLHPQKKRIDIFGRQWELSLSVSSTFVKELKQTKPTTAFLVSMIISLLTSLLAVAIAINFITKQKNIHQQAKLNESLEQQIVQRTQDLKNANKLFTDVLKAASEVSIIATAPDGIVTVFNQGAEKLLGYSAAEIIGKTTPALFHREDEMIARGAKLTREYNTPVEGFNVFIHKPLLNGRETRRWTYIHKNGSERLVSLNVTVMRDDQGEVIGFLGIARDITQEELNKRELVTTRDKLTIAADIAQLGIWVWDGEKKSLEWNDHMFRIYEQPISLREKGLSYNHWIERLHPEDAEYAQAILRAASYQGGVTEARFRILLPSGKINYVDAIVSVECNSDGSLKKVIGVNRDITQQITQEQSLRLAKEQADAANKSKSEFLANMSHEIRTPMNAVMGMLELLYNTDLTHSQKDYTFKAKNAAKSLLELLNDLLDFSKIEAGKLSVEFHPFSTNNLIDVLAPLLVANKTHKDIEVIMDIDPHLAPAYVGDELRLQQVLINLVSNAIKFTEKGYVKISIRCVEKNAQEARLRFEVKDTGIGISPIQQGRIFDAFMQAEASTSRRYGGTGLGLAICKRITQLMNSDLHIESSIGNGSRFWFEVTLTIANSSDLALLQQQSHSAIKMETALLGLKLLVVEDNELNRQVACELLGQAGAEVELATGGYEAIEKITLATQLPTTKPFDLVLMDLQMPGMDGLEATRLIRAHEQFTHLPILAMTANVAQSDKEACLTAGMNGHLGKPIDITKVISGILIALGRSLPTDSPATLASSTHTTINSIKADKLLNESNGIIVEELNIILQRFGNNHLLFTRMLSRFRPEVSRLFIKITEAAVTNNVQDVTVVLHSLKGITATMGAKTLAAKAAALEEACKGVDGSELTFLLHKEHQILYDLFEQSEKILLQMSAKSTLSSASATENKNATLCYKNGTNKLSSTLINQLKVIRPLILEGRLDALRMTETLYQQSRDLQLPDHPQLKELWQQASALDYANALKILDAILSNQESQVVP